MSRSLCRGRPNWKAGKNATFPCGRLICLPRLSTPPGFPCQRTNLWTARASCPPSKVKPTNSTTNCTGVLRVPMESGPFAAGIGNWSQRNDRVELFDLEKDLSETTDLAAKHPKVVSELTDKYNAWLDEMADPISKQEKRWNPDAGAPAKKCRKKKRKRHAKKESRTHQSARSKEEKPKSLNHRMIPARAERDPPHCFPKISPCHENLRHIVSVSIFCLWAMAATVAPRRSVLTSSCF